MHITSTTSLPTKQKPSRDANMKFSASAPTLLAVAVALAAQAASVDAKLCSTDWDVRGDASDADQALRQLKGGGANGTGKSKSNQVRRRRRLVVRRHRDRRCAAAALADQVCAAEGLLYPWSRAGSDVAVSGPTFNSQAVLGAVGTCGPQVLFPTSHAPLTPCERGERSRTVRGTPALAPGRILHKTCDFRWSCPCFPPVGNA